jgi:hypothetical protein
MEGKRYRVHRRSRRTPGGALRQIFAQAERRDNETFTVLELTERHFGFKGFSPPQAQGLMESTMAHKKAA